MEGCFLNFAGDSQCNDYKHNTHLNLIYIINIFSITFLSLDNQQNGTPSLDL